MMTELENSFIEDNDNDSSKNEDVLVVGTSTSGRRQKRRRRDEAVEDGMVLDLQEEGSVTRPVEIGDDGDDNNNEKRWSHEVSVEMLSPGDQVYVYRGAIQHHGIVTHVPRADALSQLEPHERPSAVHVVHFDSACDGVETTTLELFLKGNTLRRARYSAGQWASSLEYGASYVVPADDPTLVVTRAKEAAKFGDGVSGWSGYSLLTNNCETFACWCSTGRRTTLSRQASRGLVGAGVVAASVSACAAAGAAAGSFAGAAGAATAMVPRGVRGVQRTVQVLEWTAGAAALAFTLADFASMVVTRSPVERNRIRNSSRSIVPVTVD
ncbi:unnamed protein product [Sphacelaria rigidula]